MHSFAVDGYSNDSEDENNPIIDPQKPGIKWIWEKSIHFGFKWW